METRDAKITQNVVVGGRRTSVRLEGILRDALTDVCDRQGIDVHQFCEAARRRYPHYGLTGAVRCSLVEYYWDSVRLGEK